MKTQLFACLTAAMAVATVFACNGAQAFWFGTEGIKFDGDTKVDFTFIGSGGSFESTLSVFQLDSQNGLTLVRELFAQTNASDSGSGSQWWGTCIEGKRVRGSCSQSFLFLKDVTYTLGLDSGSNGTVYSTNSLNTESNGTLWISQESPAGGQQAVFSSFGSAEQDGIQFDNPHDFQSGNPFAHPVIISFDDRGITNRQGIPDLDFQDFSIAARARAVSSVPEPAPLVGLGVTAIAIVASRRRTREIS